MIYLDMDGVLADLTAAALRVHGREDLATTWPRGVYLLSQALGMTEAETWAPINACGTSFWADLERCQWADDLVGLASRYRDGEVMIASSPLKPPAYHSAAGKLIWLERHFGGRFASPEHYMLGARKEKLAEPGAILIDDSDQNVDRFRARGGKAILVPQPWNSLRDEPLSAPGDKLEYVRTQLYRLRA